MRIIFSLEWPPSAKLLLESPDGVIKPLQLAQRSDSSPKVWQNQWMSETNETLLTSPTFLQSYFILVLDQMCFQSKISEI